MARRPSLVTTPREGEKEVEITAAPVVKKDSRTGKRSFAFWIDETFYEEVRVATFRMKTTIQAAGEEMLADWCRKHAIKMPER